MVLATEAPLCLDPSPVVALLAAKAHHARHKFATVPLRRHATKRYSQAGQNRKRKLESLAAPSELRLHDFIQTQRAAAGPTPGKRKVAPTESLRLHQEAAHAAMRLQESATLPPPSCVTGSLNLASPELRLALPPQVRPLTSFSPLSPLPRPFLTPLTPSLPGRRAEVRAADWQAGGDVGHDAAAGGGVRARDGRARPGQGLPHQAHHPPAPGQRRVHRRALRGEGLQGGGQEGLHLQVLPGHLALLHLPPRFLLGTRTNALRYINQFTEIFTEEGRKNVKITHRVPNQQPRVTFTAGMRATMASAQQAAAADPPPAAPASQAPPGTPQAAILQSRAAPTPPTVTVALQVRPVTRPHCSTKKAIVHHDNHIKK